MRAVLSREAMLIATHPEPVPMSRMRGDSAAFESLERRKHQRLGRRPRDENGGDTSNESKKNSFLPTR